MGAPEVLSRCGRSLTPRLRPSRGGGGVRCGGARLTWLWSLLVLLLWCCRPTIIASTTISLARSLIVGGGGGWLCVVEKETNHALAHPE